MATDRPTVEASAVTPAPAGDDDRWAEVRSILDGTPTEATELRFRQLRRLRVWRAW
jgi:hypothetical protein